MNHGLWPVSAADARTERRWLSRMVAETGIVVFAHDPDVPAATLHQRNGKIEIEPVDLNRSFPGEMRMPRVKRTRGEHARSKAPVAEIGVIGGSGLYAMEGLTNVRELRVKTPFGEPSDAFIMGTVEGKRVAFLARHARGHLILPSELNFRANVYAMKLLGVRRIISVSAVGSLQENLRPGEFLVPDQFFDGTKGRKSTFFGNGLVAHVTFDKPTCPQLSTLLAHACVSSGVTVHRKGTYICMEGPQFSTLAEALYHRAMKFDVIGMTNVTEAKLAREAEICYSTIAMITDYDCWHPEHDSVTVATIIATLNQNATNAQNVLRQAIKSMPAEHTCKCADALRHAILTNPKLVPVKTKKNLAAIIGKYIS